MKGIAMVYAKHNSAFLQEVAHAMHEKRLDQMDVFAYAAGYGALSELKYAKANNADAEAITCSSILLYLPQVCKHIDKNDLAECPSDVTFEMMHELIDKGVINDELITEKTRAQIFACVEMRHGIDPAADKLLARMFGEQQYAVVVSMLPLIEAI